MKGDESLFNSQADNMIKFFIWVSSINGRRDRMYTRVWVEQIFLHIQVLQARRKKGDACMIDCKTVGFFLKISKEIGEAWGKSLKREARKPHTSVRRVRRESLPSLALCFQPRSRPFVGCSRIARTWIRRNTDCLAVYVHELNCYFLTSSFNDRICQLCPWMSASLFVCSVPRHQPKITKAWTNQPPKFININIKHGKLNWRRFMPYLKFSLIATTSLPREQCILHSLHIEAGRITRPHSTFTSLLSSSMN